MSDEKAVRDANRLAAFLNDDVVKDALASLNKKYFDEFKSATEPAVLQTAAAKARVLDDFGVELQRVIDRGVTANATLQRQERTRTPNRKS